MSLKVLQDEAKRINQEVKAIEEEMRDPTQGKIREALGGVNIKDALKAKKAELADVQQRILKAGGGKTPAPGKTVRTGGGDTDSFDAFLLGE
jgi:hypothetical protein